MDFDKILNKLAELGTTWGVRIVGVTVALIVAVIIANWARRAIIRSLEGKRFDPSLGRFFANLVRWSILLGAILGCLGVFGIQTTSFAAVIAAAGLAIGLAFQGTLSNFSAGVMLLIFRPYKVEDLIKVDGELGIVTDLDLFSTTIRTLDNRQIIIPNGKIFGNKLENINAFETRRVDVPVGVEYGADIDKTREVLATVPGKIELALEDPPPQIFLKELGASSVDWVIRVWCNTPDYWVVYEETIRHAKKAPEEAGLGIPFPQMDVHFDSAAIEAFGRR